MLEVTTVAKTFVGEEDMYIDSFTVRNFSKVAIFVLNLPIFEVGSSVGGGDNYGALGEDKASDQNYDSFSH